MADETDEPQVDVDVDVDVEAPPPQPVVPLEQMIREAAQTGARSLDDQFALLAKARGFQPKTGAAAGPVLGPTWSERSAQPDYQQASTDRKNEIRAAWLANESKYALAKYTKKKDQDAYMEGVIEVVPSIKAPTRSVTESLGDLLTAFKSGTRGIGGAVGGFFRPTEEFAGDPDDPANFWNAAAASAAQKRYKESLSAKTKDEQLYYEEQHKKVAEGDVLGEASTTIKAVKKYPMLAAMLMSETAPSVLATAVPAGLVGRGAHLALRAIGIAEQQAARWAASAGLGAGMTSGGIQGAGQARNQVVEQLMAIPDDRWETDDEYVLLRDQLGGDKEAAKRAIAETRSILPGVIGGVLAGLSGRIGLEKALVGAAGKGIRARLGALVAEEAGEVGEETAIAALANWREQQIVPEKSIAAGLGRTAAETAVGAAPGAAVAAVAPRRAEAAAEPGAEPPGPAAPAGEPAAPAPPPGPPAGFREDVDRRVAALDDRLAAVQEDTGLTDDQRAEVTRGIEAERAAWQTAREQYENTAPITEGRQEVERLTREIAEIEGRPIDEDTKTKQIASRTTRLEELSGMLALNDLNEGDLEAYSRARKQAIEDANEQRGRGAKGIDVARIERESNFADRLLLERALVETPTEVAFAARERNAFPRDESGNPVYPSREEIDNRETRAALDTLADVTQSRIWMPRNNPKYTRAERATLIRQARQYADAIERARVIMDMPAEQLTATRDTLIAAVVDIARRGGNFDQGRITELAAVFAREAQARGETINFRQARTRAEQTILGLIRGGQDDPGAAPPANAPPPGPAPGTPAPGGEGVGYEVHDGWLIYTSTTPITDGNSRVGVRPNNDQRTAILEQLRQTFTGNHALHSDVVKLLNIRYVHNVDAPATLGWYYPSRGQPWKVGTSAIDIERQGPGRQRVHTAAHEIGGHALDDMRRTGVYMSTESGQFAPGTALRREIEAANSRHTSKQPNGLDFSYPLYSPYPEGTMQCELFAQVIGYYHSSGQDLASAAPTAYALAKEIVDGLNQLQSSGQLDQQRAVEVVQRALSGVGGAAGAPGGVAPGGGPAGPGQQPSGGGAGAGVAAPVRQPNDQLLNAVADATAELSRQTRFLGGDEAARARNDAVAEAIRLTEREVAAEGARAEGAAAAAPARRAEAAPGVAREAPAGARAPAREGEGARGRAAERAPATAEAGRRAEGAGKPPEISAALRTESALEGQPASTPDRVTNALAAIFGIKPDQVRKFLPRVEIALDADIKDGKITLRDKSQLSGLADQVLAGYDPKSNSIILIADRIPRGWERAVLLHELFHKRGGQLLGRKEIERFRTEFRSWKDAKEGTPERRIYDAAMPRIRAAVRGKKGQKLIDTFDEETLPYAIEEAVKLGIDVDPKKVLAKGAQGWLSRMAQAVSDEIARFFGRPPRAFNAVDLMAAAFGAAQLELTDTTVRTALQQQLNRVGGERAQRALRATEGFALRRAELKRGEGLYVPERVGEKGRASAVRPSEVTNDMVYSELPAGSPLRNLSLSPADEAFASPTQAARAANQAPPPGPTEPKFSIFERFSPKTAAPIKSREQLGNFADTLKAPEADWLPQKRSKFIENWLDHQRPFLNWLQQFKLPQATWREIKLIPGKLRDAVQQYEMKMLDPLAAKVNEFGRKHKLDSATAAEVTGQWTTMRHIPEANAALRDKLRERVAAGGKTAAEDLRLFDRAQRGQMTPEERANYGGMAGGLTDAEANAIREKLEARFPVADLQAIGDDIVAGFAKLRDDSLKSGQLSPDVVKKFPKFRYYVALTGTPWDDTQISDGFGSYVAPNLLREREGRGSVADPALIALSDRVARVAAYSASRDFKRELNKLYEGAGGEKNAVGLSRFVANAVQRPEISDVVWQGDDGKRYVFRWDKEHMGVGEAILSKNREFADNMALSAIDRSTRLFSKAVTQWTFMFAPVNNIRDMQEKAMLIRTRNVRDAEGNALDANALFANSWKEWLNSDNWKAAYQLARDKRANAVTLAGQYANDLVTQGGVSTWGEKLSRGRDEIHKEVAKHSGFRKGLKKAEKFVEGYNLMMEVMSSIAVHAAMRKMGVDPKEAAFQTLQLMNFNNQGAKTAYIRAFYSFFNPAIQSGANLLGQLSTKRGFYDMVGMIILSLVMQTIARATGEDDEELGNELDQRGSFEAERNITFKFMDTFWKIPVGYGLPQFAHSLAVNGSRYMTGRYDGSSALAQQGTAFLKTFSPIPPSEIEFFKQPANFFLKSITPTVFRPVVDLATDTNAWGNKLTAFYPDRTKFATEQGKPQTPVFFKERARELREYTGIDIYPEQMRAILEGVAWGPAGYLMKSIADSNADMEGRKKDPLDQVPGSTILRLLGASRFVGGQSRYLDARYHEEFDKASVDQKEQNEAKVQGKEAEWRRENPEKASRVDALKAQERVMRGIAKDYNATIKEIQARDSELTDEAELAKLARIQAKREEAMRDFLRKRKIAIDEED